MYISASQGQPLIVGIGQQCRILPSDGHRRYDHIFVKSIEFWNMGFNIGFVLLPSFTGCRPSPATYELREFFKIRAFFSIPKNVNG